jgi:hypothetical protein
MTVFQIEAIELQFTKRICKRWDLAMVSINSTEIWQSLSTEAV